MKLLIFEGNDVTGKTSYIKHLLSVSDEYVLLPRSKTDYDFVNWHIDRVERALKLSKHTCKTVLLDRFCLTGYLHKVVRNPENASVSTDLFALKTIAKKYGKYIDLRVFVHESDFLATVSERVANKHFKTARQFETINQLYTDFSLGYFREDIVKHFNEVTLTVVNTRGFVL